MSIVDDPLVALPHWRDEVDPLLVVAGNECAGLSPGLAVVAQIPTGEIVGANPTACALIGMTWEDLLGRTAMDPRWGVIARDGLPVGGDLLPPMEAMRTGEARRGVVLGVRHPARGSVVWLEVSSTPVPAVGGGTCVGVVSVIEDVTHTPRGVAATRSVAALYRLLAENVSDIVMLSDEHGLIEWVSPSVTAGLGWAPSSMIGHAPAEFIHPDDLPSVVGAIRKATFEGTDTGTTVARWVSATGTYRWMNARGAAVRDGDGRVVGGIDALRDIHEEVLERQALEAGREAEYRLLAENASDIVVRLDTSGAITWVSPAVEAASGWRPEELLGRAMPFANPDEDVALAQQRWAALLQRGWGSYETRVRLRDGAVRWFDVRLRVATDADGAPVSVVGAARDIDREVRAREALVESEERFRLAWELAAAGMSLVAPDGRFEQVNTALCRMLGRSADELRGLTWRDITHPDDLDSGRQAIRDVYDGTIDGFRQLKRYLRPDGSVVWGDLSVTAVRDGGGHVRRTISQVVDVTAEHEAAARLDDLTRHDPLTGVLSRAALEDAITQALTARRTQGDELAVLFADLRGFRLVNDSLGHAAGDALLQEVAARLRTMCGPGCAVGRFGGDHFVVVVHGLDEASLDRLASRLCDVIGAEAVIGGHAMTTSLAIGIAQAHAGSAASDLLRDAETALTAAQRGRGRPWQFFDRTMHERAVSRLRLERELRAAVERREFVVHYQPIVTLHDRAVIGHEALVRWAHPDHGLLPPDRFIPAAEETGLIVEIGAQVLETVAARLAVDPDAGRISVNVSGVQLRDPEWGPRCRETVTDAGADPARLVIEVTETAVITVLDHVRRSLTTMRAAGVGLHIDDFGSGFSSLSLLRDLPVTGIKLDRSFVHTLGPGGGSANALASGVAFLAAGLGLETIAEGIETEQQATMLRGQGWREGQGFLFGRPGPWPS